VFELNGAHQLLVYADINLLDEDIRAIKQNTEALVAVNKEIGVEVNAEKTQYMVMSRDQNAEHSHNIKIDSKSFGRKGGLAPGTVFGNSPNGSKLHSWRK
jgi:hypothetical protein